jgi:hypothetical protein
MLGVPEVRVQVDSRRNQARVWWRPLGHATSRDHAFFNGGGLDVRHLAGGVKAAEYGVPMDSIHPGTPAIH